MIVAIGVKNISRVGAVDDNGPLDDKMFLEKQEGPKKSYRPFPYTLQKTNFPRFG